MWGVGAAAGHVSPLAASEYSNCLELVECVSNYDDSITTQIVWDTTQIDPESYADATDKVYLYAY